MRMNQSRSRTCAACGRDFELRKYSGSAGTSRHRRFSYCPDCRTAAAPERSWDWTAAVCKSSMLASLHRNDGEWSPRVDPGTLRALMELQKGRCACTGVGLTYPNPELELPRGSALWQWARDQNLDPRLRLRMPALVRAVVPGPWEPGNIVFLAQFMESAYAYAGSLSAMINLFKAPSAQVPTAAAITRMRARLENH